MTDKAKENLDLALKKLEEGVREIFESEKYKDMLKTIRKFHSYSTNNIIMIFSQKPDATRVAGFTTWKKLGRNVKKGENGISILAPIKRKYEAEVEKLDEDGNIKKEKVQREYLTYKTAYVFDISQTEGKELNIDFVKILDNEKEGYSKLYEVLKTVTDCKVIEKDTGSANGYYSRVNNEIAIKGTNPIEQKIKTLIHEIAHSKLHSSEECVLMDSKLKEIEAESTAFVVCDHLGIDASEYSFGYVAGWSRDKDSEYLKSVIDKIKDVSKEIIDDIEKKYIELEKESEKTNISLKSLIEESKEKCKEMVETDKFNATKSEIAL